MTTWPDRALRDIATFGVILAVIIGVTGWWGATGANSGGGEGPEMLAWLAGPSLASATIMFHSGWWCQSGLKLDFISKYGYYLIALAAAPITSAFVIALGCMAGVVSVGALAPDTFSTLLVPALFPALIKNLFEEFCWRGFLTSRFEDTKVAGLHGHLLTGLLWSVWHVPYVFVFMTEDQVVAMSGVGPTTLFSLSLIVLPLQSIFFGELRLASNSIWPCVVLHSTSNMTTLLLFSGGAVSVEDPMIVVFAPGTHGILYTALLGAAGFAWMQRRGK